MVIDVVDGSTSAKKYLTIGRQKGRDAQRLRKLLIPIIPKLHIPMNNDDGGAAFQNKI